MTKGKIYLIPSFLGEDNPNIIPQQIKDVVQTFDIFIVEQARTARRYLRAIGFMKNFDTEVTIHEMDKHAKAVSYDTLLKDIAIGKNIGVISEAGSPCIADPGSDLVAHAHKRGIEVVPLVGPNAILLALIGSGFNGQQFTFNGYLPLTTPERIKKIKQLEAGLGSRTTQLFMETPFRNQKLLDELLRTCHADTKLCIACDLTLPTQLIRTQKIADWKKSPPNLQKRYCVFVMGV
jgi:16S rRNA (cytidine1402-2'-O)-methyltransferase